MIKPARQKHLHQANVIRIHIRFPFERHFRRFFVRALAQPDAAAIRQQVLHVLFASVQIRLDDRPNRGILCAHALHNLNRSLRVNRTFHIHAQEVVISSGALDNRKGQPFAKLRVEVQAQRRQFAGNICIDSVGCNFLENFKVRIARMLRVRRGSNILTQIVQADEHTELIADARCGNGFIQRLAGNKTMRHTPGPGVGSDPICESLAFRKLQECRTEHTLIIMTAWEAPYECVCPSRNFSASSAAMQPEPAAVTACR